MPFDGFLNTASQQRPFAKRIGAQNVRLEKTPEEKRGAFFFSHQSAAAPSENARRDGRLAPEKSVIVYVYSDQVNNPQKIANPSRTLVWDREQEPFGETYATPTSTTPTTHRFPGQIYDSENGLNYNNARDYDPTLGSYLEHDPLGFGGGYNLYAYAGQNPTQWIDPSGLLMKDANGHVIFVGSWWNFPKRSNDGSIARLQAGHVIADDGTQIPAFKNSLPGNNGQGRDWNSNCHGTALADSEVWIEDPDADTVVKHDRYVQVQTPDIGDLAIVRDSKGGTPHSATVSALQTLPGGGTSVTVSQKDGSRAGISNVPVNQTGYKGSIEYYHYVPNLYIP